MLLMKLKIAVVIYGRGWALMIASREDELSRLGCGYCT